MMTSTQLGAAQMTNKMLIAFDFDHTLVDLNSDLHVKTLAPDGQLPEEIEATYSDDGWTHYMGTIFRYLHGIGKREADLKSCMHEIPLTSGMKELLDFASNGGHECIIISDSNSVFIHYILDNFNLRSNFSEVYTNPAYFDESGCLNVDFYHTQDWCDLSTINLCKGDILKNHIKKRQEEGVNYSRVVYVGDGSNDLCPALELSESDYVCARKEFRLLKKIKKLLSADKKSKRSPNSITLKAQLCEWDTGLEILQVLKEIK